MTDEFKKARDSRRPNSINADCTEELCEWKKYYKAGVDWCYKEYYQPALDEIKIWENDVRELTEEKEQLTKEAEALADALAHLENSWVASPQCASLWQFAELHPSLTYARDALTRWRKFRGEK